MPECPVCKRDVAVEPSKVWEMRPKGRARSTLLIELYHCPHCSAWFRAAKRPS